LLSGSGKTTDFLDSLRQESRKYDRSEPVIAAINHLSSQLQGKKQSIFGRISGPSRANIVKEAKRITNIYQPRIFNGDISSEPIVPTVTSTMNSLVVADALREKREREIRQREREIRQLERERRQREIDEYNALVERQEREQKLRHDANQYKARLNILERYDKLDSDLKRGIPIVNPARAVGDAKREYYRQLGRDPRKIEDLINLEKRESNARIHSQEGKREIAESEKAIMEGEKTIKRRIERVRKSETAQEKFDRQLKEEEERSIRQEILDIDSLPTKQERMARRNIILSQGGPLAEAIKRMLLPKMLFEHSQRAINNDLDIFGTLHAIKRIENMKYGQNRDGPLNNIDKFYPETTNIIRDTTASRYILPSKDPESRELIDYSLGIKQTPRPVLDPRDYEELEHDGRGLLTNSVSSRRRVSNLRTIGRPSSKKSIKYILDENDF